MGQITSALGLYSRNVGSRIRLSRLQLISSLKDLGLIPYRRYDTRYFHITSLKLQAHGGHLLAAGSKVFQFLFYNALIWHQAKQAACFCTIFMLRPILPTSFGY